MQDLVCCTHFYSSIQAFLLVLSHWFEFSLFLIKHVRMYYNLYKSLLLKNMTSSKSRRLVGCKVLRCAKRLILTSQVGYDSSVSKLVQVEKYQPILLHLYTHAPGISLLFGVKLSG